MKKIIPFFFLAFGVLFFNAQTVAANQLPDFTSIVENAKDSVVNISTSKTVKGSEYRKNLDIPNLPEGSPFGELFKKFFDQNGGMPDHETNSLGSGFIISKDGYILTNNHVVDGAGQVVVRLNDREEYDAKVIGTDKDTDVALIKIDGNNFPTLKFGDSNALKVGEWVLAIGSPFGFDHTVTAGIVSAKSRNLPTDNYVPFIQTDVAINPGNSGGPLFNMKGEVVGINSQIYSRSGGFMGLSFAIPIELAVDVAKQIKENGKVSRGWLGVLIQEVTRDLAETFGMKTPYGALVAKVMDGSPAQDAGLQVGDVIIEFNGKKVTHSSSLPPLVGRTPVDKYADVTIIRDHREKTIRVKIAQLPSDITQASAAPAPKVHKIEKSALGMSVTPLDKDTRDNMNLSSGVLVMDVDQHGPASAAGIRKGDVISMIDNHGVDSVDEFKSVVDGLKDGKSVAILIQRSNGPVFLAIKPEKS
jgi:serine protease Do